MPLAFPNFENSHFVWMTACGEIPSADESLTKWLKGEPDRIAPLPTPRGVGRARLMLGGESGNHVHLDAFGPELMREKLKNTSGSVEDIQNSMERLAGKEIKVNLRGGFQAAVQELPETGIIRPLLFKTKMGNVAIKLEGATLAIEGAPVSEIAWHEGPQGNIRITLEAEAIRRTLSDTYLTDLAEILQRTFDVFILAQSQTEQVTR